MKKLISLVVALLAVAAVSVPVVAVHADTPAAPAQGASTTKYAGKVTAVDTSKNQITISSKKKGDHTFTITPDTNITVAGSKADSTAIQVGMRATVQSADGTTATQIDAKAGKGGAAPAPPAPAPAAPAAPVAPAAPPAPAN